MQSRIIKREMNKKNNKKVAIAMSGGIDSSVAAFLLKEKKYQVFALTMNLGPFSKELIKQSKKISTKLNIKHYFIDLEKEFKDKIINPFCLKYSQGKTPNPCIWCNKMIKFDVLLKKAQQLGADYLATGHYSQIKTINNQQYLLRAKDKTRDQSYFLYRLSSKQLENIIFPLARIKKKKVKKIAQKKGLDLGKKESREICFVQNDYQDFIKNNCSLDFSPGLIKNKKGEILGKHQGLPFYTIGQRKGLIRGQKNPVYVIKIDKQTNCLVVGEEKDLFKKELIAKNISWVNKEPDFPLRAKAKIRYRHNPAQAIITKTSKEELKVEFKKAQRAITPGQSIVFYQKNIVLGGGIIK